MAMIVEQAGGAPLTGSNASWHERCGVILGSRAEVERVAGYHEV